MPSFHRNSGVTYALAGIVALVIVASGTFAQDDLPINEGASGLHQMLKRLQTTASVLHVVAHPDDEDGPLMCYCSRGLGVRTMLFSITRGEGGANLISSHFFDELGALRTLEHVKAAQYYGSELFYSSATDYGYSKNLDEANRTWNNGEQILRELVEVVRREQPTIIMARFRGDPRDGHGHHQMAGVLARTAFHAAADPTQFPEQLERGLKTWQPYKLYVNDRPDPNQIDQNGIVAVPTGDYDPVLGKSYGQIARYGLGFQRSQGILGHIGEAGEQQTHYRLQSVADGVSLAKREQKPTDNLDVDVTDIGKLPGQTVDVELPSTLSDGSAELAIQIQSAVDAFVIENPAATIDPLSKALKTACRLLEQLPSLDLTPEQRTLARNQLQLKSSQLNDAMCLAAGVHLDVSVRHTPERGGGPLNFATPGQELIVESRLVVRNAVSAQVTAMEFQTPSDWSVQFVGEAGTDVPGSDLPTAIPQNKPFTRRVIVAIPADASPTKPYWSRSSIREPFYDVDADNGQSPLPASPLIGHASLVINDTLVTTQSVAEARFRDSLFGDVRYPLHVAPPVSIGFSLPQGVLPKHRGDYQLDVTVRSLTDAQVEGQLRLDVPTGWQVEPEQYEIRGLRSENEESQHRFSLRPTSAVSESPSQPCRVRAVVDWNGSQYDQSVTTVTARDLDRVNLYRPAEHTIHLVDVQVQGNPRVGYINGSGDDVAQSLAMLGVTAKTLTGEDLATGDLSQFDVILVGVRAYAVRKDLRENNARLLDFVRLGGTLIVQYQTPEFDKNFGPYPYKMGRRPEEVSEEDAVVTMLDPAHPMLSQPNKINSADFDGWLEQRGSKFLMTWGDEYVPLLECHDTGQEPQSGGLLVARYGKGVYVYSAYAWYRQLPNGVPGAFRIMANHLSLPVTVAGK